MPQTAFVSAPYTGFDSFTRANQSGFGNATDGQTWVQSPGAYTLSIASNEGKLTGTTGAAVILLGSQKVADAEGVLRMAVSSTSDSIALVLRATATNNFYLARFGFAATTVDIAKIIAGTSTQLVSATFAPGANTFFWVRFRVSGKNLSAKWWLASSAEPSAWTLTTTDTSIAGVTGQFGIRANLLAGTDNIQIDNFSVRSLDTIIQAHTGVGRIG